MYLLSFSHFIGTRQEREVDFLTPTEMPLGLLLSMDIPRLLKLRASKAGLSLLPPVKPSSICPSLKVPISAAQAKIWLLAWNLPVPNPPQCATNPATPLPLSPGLPTLTPTSTLSSSHLLHSAARVVLSGGNSGPVLPVTDSTLPVFACSARLSSFGNSTPIYF